jgi:hypothetical protein
MQVVDVYMDSAILVCDECRGPYIVCKTPEPRSFRKCPHCNAQNEVSYEDALEASDARAGKRWRGRLGPTGITCR